MPSASAIIGKLNRALTTVGSQSRVVYKRTVTRTGGDPLLGKKGTITSVDTLLTPQPYWTRIGRDEIRGGHAPFYDRIDADGKERLSDDYEFVFSPDTITRAELENPDVLIVLKDTDGSVETLRLTDFLSPSLQGKDVVLIAVYRFVGEGTV